MPAESIPGDFLDRIQKLSPKRLALLAAELERRLAARETYAVEPIAVIGMGCRMPGAGSPEALWELLAAGRDAIEEIPASRWDAEAFYDPRPEIPGKANTKWGGFVADIDQWDAAFFGISPREAVGMDPQQRMLLEVSWEALENACVRADALDGSPTGVFIGMSTNDYASLLDVNDTSAFDAYSGSGIARSVAAGRLSYFLGLKGPNLSIDTACSSSAVAIHLACQSLRQRECRLALAGGVNAILAPHLTVTLAQARMLAADGRCKTFSQSADGFVRSEGCGMLVVKRLTDAQADGDRILGVIRGSAINHDGRSSGLTAPNGPSQEIVIRAALTQAGLQPEELDYLEAHGTGTVLGDAIELGALASVFAKRNETGLALMIGSVKTNIGHLEAAAGAAGVIKTLLALQHETIPPHLHVTEGRENEALHGSPLKIPLAATPWPLSSRPRVAGVSSFGFSGTNAHLVIEQAPALRTVTNDPVPVEVVTLSAKSAAALWALCGRHAHHLRCHPELSLADFAYTLNTGRSHFQHRIALLASSVQEVAEQLQSIADDHSESNAAYRFNAGYNQPSLGFLFTGQGSQYAGMGRDLYAANTIFRGSIDRCDAILEGKLPHRLSAVLCDEQSLPAGLIDDTTWTQPALFAFEYALSEVWRSWGVRAATVLGHSLGEYVAACVAGVLPLDAALVLAYERGRLMGSLPKAGGMLAVRGSEADVAEILRPLDRLSIAAVNGIRSVVVSGDSAQIEELRKLLAAKGLAAQPLTVSHAFHSAMMEPILDEFESLAANLTYAEPQVSLISNVTGRVHNHRIDASYWRKHIRGAVRYADGVDAMLSQHPAALVEIGPDPILLGMAKPALSESPIPCIASLRRGKNSLQTMYEGLRQLYLLGVPVAWDQVYRDRLGVKLSLPTYAFQRQRYWIATPEKVPTPRSLAAVVTSDPFDPLLYTIEWQMADVPPFESPNPQHLIAIANSIIEANSALDRIVAYDEFLPSFDRLCTIYIWETFSRLGARVDEGDRLAYEDFYTRLGIRREHRRLVDRLLAILEEEGLAHSAEGLWCFHASPSVDASSERDRLQSEFPQFAAELTFLGQAGHLADVLRGRMTPLEALFPNGSMRLAEQVYQDAPAAQLFNRAVGETLRTAVAAYPPDYVVKITEVGAGTGSTTSQVLPLLDPKHVEYRFTDVSPAFCTAARSKFANFPFVRYATLDLENEDDPAFSQTADIILAANVLHATADLLETLGRIARMLRPGGSLMILEGTSPQRFGDLTVGMTEGWWRFTDTARRERYPLISRESWISLLAEAGFQCAALEESTTLTRQQTILVAKLQPRSVSDTVPSVFCLGAKVELEELVPALLKTGLKVHQLDDQVSQSLQMERDKPENRGEAFARWLRSAEKHARILLALGPASEGTTVADAALSNAAQLLEVLQAAIAEQRPIPIWIVTRCAAPVDKGGTIDLSASCVDAMLKTARLEHPELPIHWVDLPSEPAETDRARLCQWVREGTTEHALALRQGRVFTPRLVSLAKVSARHAQHLSLAPDAAFMVTGAYGGLGFRTVEWLIERGTECVVMVGRHEPSSQQREQIAVWRNLGIRIYDLTADVSVQREVEALFRQISELNLNLRGMIHAAGSLDDGTILQQTPARLAGVFAAKVQGSWLLHEHSKRLPLDFFVLFGSGASVLGSPGQCNHAAANGFLDSLSHLRRRNGLAATAIAWGAWSSIGAATRIKDTGRAERLGFGAISPEKGIELLEQAIASGLPQVAALPIDWQRYLAPGQITREWPFFAELLTPAPETDPSSASPAALKDLLESSPAHSRLGVLQDHLQARIAEVLQMAPGSVLRADQPLAELGLDSLMALELKNGIQKELEISLPANFFFEYPTLEMAATFVSARLVTAPRSARPQKDSSEYEELAF